MDKQLKCYLFTYSNASILLVSCCIALYFSVCQISLLKIRAKNSDYDGI